MTFSHKFQMKRWYLLSNSLESLLPSACKDAFTGSLAQSVQELWPIISSPATSVAGAGVKGFGNWAFKVLKHQRYAILICNRAPKSTSIDLTAFESNYTLNEIHEQTLISTFQRSSIALLIIHHPKYKRTHIFSCSAYFLNSTILISVSPNSVISTIIL